MSTQDIARANGEEKHPAFGLVSVSRLSCHPGAVLFDSDVRHQHVVSMRVKTASRKRALGADYIHEEKTIVEVRMSEAQWASVVSSVGMGTGVPATLTWRDGPVSDLPPEARLRQSMQEVSDAAGTAFDAIKEAQAALDALDRKAPAKERRAAEARLRSAINNAVPNVEFAARQMTEHAENVVVRSRADIEAMVHRAGLASAQQSPLMIEEDQA